MYATRALLVVLACCVYFSGILQNQRWMLGQQQHVCSNVNHKDMNKHPRSKNER